MKLTLLELVNDMLTALTSEGVTTVSDTEESLTCVNICNRVFESLIYYYPWRHLQTGRGALTAGTYKNELKGPSNTIRIEDATVWYGDITDEGRSLVLYQSPEAFIAAQINMDPADDNIEAVNGINVYNDRNPTYFTSFDGLTYVFDSIPTTTGLLTADSFAAYAVGPSARVTTGSTTFNLPAQVYPYFRDMCIEMALLELKNEGREALIRDTKSWGMLRSTMRLYPKLLVDQTTDRDLITVRAR